MLDLRSFFPFGPHLADIYDYLAQAREHEPIFFSAALGAWCATRYDDIREIAGDPEAFSSLDAFPRPVGLPAEAQAAADFLFGNTIVTLGDPPRHTAVRRIVHEGFKPSAIAAFEPAIREIVADRVDRLPAAGTFDLVSEFADHVPLEVVMRVTGFPASENANLRRWMTDQIALFAGTAALSEEQLVAHGRSYFEGIAYLRELVEVRRAAPTDDLISIMLKGDPHGRVLGVDEIVAQTMGLVSAGWETTGNAVVNTVRALLDPPSGWAALVDGDVDVAQVVAEGLRYDSSVLGLFRTVVRDATVGGVDFHPGDRVFLLYVSANHDAEQFAAAEEFRLDRTNAARHLSFGYGIHNCIGAPLARLEMEIVLELLAARYPRLRLADGTGKPEYKPFSQFRGPGSLPVTAT